MIDIQLLRKDPEGVAKRLATRGAGRVRRGAFQRSRRRARSCRPRSSRRRPRATASPRTSARPRPRARTSAPLLEQGEKLKALLEKSGAAARRRCRQEIQDFLERIPNLPHESVPVGASSEDNREERRWGEPRKFDFPVKDHVDVGEGARRARLRHRRQARRQPLRGDARRGRAPAPRARAVHARRAHARARLHRGLRALHGQRASAPTACRAWPKFKDDLFKIEGRELYLIPTAEYPVTNFVRDEIVELKSLPLKFVCHSPVLPLRGGLGGKDTRGMIRNHQFDKVEIVQIVHPAKSYAGARGADRPRRGDPEEARAAVPRGVAVHRRHRLRAAPRPTTSRSGCRRRTPTARSPRARTSRPSRRGACRRASATRRASPSWCTR